MKKSLLALAALTAFAGAASAQSSVTLFGIVDLAATSIKNGSAGTTKSLTADGINSSRIGLRGIEDLGGGLRAGFWLEGGISPDTGCGNQGATSGSVGSPAAIPAVSTTVNQATGQPLAAGSAPSVTPASQTCIGQNWQRRSTLSLIGGFGEVRLGRDYTPTFNNIAAFDVFGYNGTGHVGNMRQVLGSGATTTVRANNTIAYFLPALGGLYGQVQVAAGEGVTGSAGTSTGNKEVSGRIGYAAGPVNVGGAYMKTYKTGAMRDELKTWNVGGSFNAGFLTVTGAFEKQDFLNFEEKLAMAGLQVPLGSGTLKAQYIRTGGSGPAIALGGVKSNLIGVGYNYDLSKRTTVYVQGAQIDNSNNAAFNIYGAATINAAGTAVGFTSGAAALSQGTAATTYQGGQKSRGYQLGVRHIF